MDLSHIPKIFWYSVSLSLLIVSGALSYTAYAAQSFTLEIANSKIMVANTANELEQLNSKLMEQAEVLEESKASLEKQLVAAKKNNKNCAKGVFVAPRLNSLIVPKQEFINNQRDLKNIKNAISKDYFK